jgi:hypothetical protein
METTFSDKVIVIAIILLILLFIKGFGNLLYLSIFVLGLYNDHKEKKNTAEQFYDFLDKYLLYISDLLDTIYLFIGSYILFFRKNNNFFTIIVSVMLIIKFLLHFLVLRRFERYFGIKNILNDETIKKLYPIKSVNSFITNTFGFIVAGYMLKVIFFNNK